MRTPDEVLAYCNAATPGPWEWWIDHPSGWPRLMAGEREIAQMGTGALCPGADVDVLSNAREDLPRLAQRVKELEAERDALRTASMRQDERAKLKAKVAAEQRINEALHHANQRIEAERDALKTLCQEAGELLAAEAGSRAMQTSSRVHESVWDMLERLKVAGGEECQETSQ